MYRDTYLTRWPTTKELDDVERYYEQKWFPGCVGASDCCKFFWKNFPSQDLNTKDSKILSIQCETWCVAELYCCYWNVGRPGRSKNIKVLLRSLLLKNIISGRFTFHLPRTYCILTNGKDCTIPYPLGDGIYADFPSFVKLINHTTDVKERTLSPNQEASREGVEQLLDRLFGLLK